MLTNVAAPNCSAMSDSSPVMVRGLAGDDVDVLPVANGS